MIPPMEEKYKSCSTCPHVRICYDWKQVMPNVITRLSGKFCPVDGSEIKEAIGLRKENYHG